jgi:hypothetical protein
LTYEIMLRVLFTEQVAVPTSAAVDVGHNLVPSSEVGGGVGSDSTCFAGEWGMLVEDQDRHMAPHD